MNVRTLFCVVSLCFALVIPLVTTRTAQAAALLPPHAYLLTDDGTLRSQDGSVDPMRVAKKFYESHADAYDFLAIYTNFPEKGAPYDYELPVRTDIRGLRSDGDTPIDLGEEYGSAGRLLGVMVFHDIAPPGSEFLPPTIGDIVHETSHYWLAYPAGVARDPGINLQRDGAHWSDFFDTSTRENDKLYLSPIGGNPWRYVGDRTFINDSADGEQGSDYQRFNWFEMYLMGFAGKSEIQPMHFIKVDGGAGSGQLAAGSEGGERETVQGTMVALTGDDLVSTLAPREPAYPAALRDFSVGYVLVLERGTQANERELSQLNYIARNFPTAWNLSTRGRSRINAEGGESGGGGETGVEDVYARERARFVGSDPMLIRRLNGRILLQDEEHGEAWWLDPVVQARRYLGRPDDAFALMREQGLGITNRDLSKIPISGGNSLNQTMAPIDPVLVNRLRGRILLQVEEHGEAWYVNPVDGLRYYLGRPADAFALMRSLGLGISNADLNRIPVMRE